MSAQHQEKKDLYIGPTIVYARRERKDPYFFVVVSQKICVFPSWQKHAQDSCDVSVPIKYVRGIRPRYLYF